MIYRIVITVLLLIGICAVGVALEPSSPRTPSTPTAAPSSSDDGAMKSLRIN